MPHLGLRWPRLILNSRNFAKVRRNWRQVGPSWITLAASWLQLAQLGGFGPFKFEKVLPAEAGGIKKSRDPQRALPRSPQGAPSGHTFGVSCPQCPSKKIYKGLSTGTGNDQSDMGQEMIRGSNTPWAEGPANFYFCSSAKAQPLKVISRKGWSGWLFAIVFVDFEFSVLIF